VWVSTLVMLAVAGKCVFHCCAVEIPRVTFLYNLQLTDSCLRFVCCKAGEDKHISCDAIGKRKQQHSSRPHMTR